MQTGRQGRRPPHIVRILLAGGTTNAFIAQELGCDVEPGLCTVGSSTDGLLCVTEPSSRKSFPNVFYKGRLT